MICFVISTLRAGGAERVISYLANEFEETAIVTLMPSDEASLFSLKPHVKLFCLGDGLKKPILTSSPFVLLKVLWRVRQTIQKLKPSCVISFLDRVNIMTLLLTRGLKIPVIVSERVDPHFHDIGRISRWLRKVTYPWAKHVVCQTQSAANYFAYPVTIIPNPVPLPSCVKKDYRPIQNILSIGRLDPQKDHKTLIKAMEAFPDMTLTIYGDGPLRRALEFYPPYKKEQCASPHTFFALRDEGVDPLPPFEEPTIPSMPRKRRNMHFPGVIKDVDKMLCSADLFVFPSLYEGFPNALCEAMRVGLPVIASDCSGNRDIVEHGINGLLFPVGDVVALQERIQYLLYHPEDAQRLGKNAKKIVKDYPMDKIKAMWQKIL